MAELATIIKEVAEKLVYYFNKRRLEVGWDDSVPKTVVGHLLPRPKLFENRKYKTADEFPELKKLLALLESEGLGIDESQTERYIKNALEECITRMNVANYQDLCHSVGVGQTSPFKRENLKCYLSDPNFQKSESDCFPPVAVAHLPTQKAVQQNMSKSSAERIVNSASRMISNLLRLTRKAYVEQMERQSKGSLYLSCSDTSEIQPMKNCDKINSISSSINFVKQDTTDSIRFGDYSSQAKKGDAPKKVNHQDGKPIHAVKRFSCDHGAGCTLFTRVSTSESFTKESQVKDEQQNISGQLETCDEMVGNTDTITTTNADTLQLEPKKQSATGLIFELDKQKSFPNNISPTTASAIKMPQKRCVHSDEPGRLKQPRQPEEERTQLQNMRRRTIQHPSDYLRSFPKDGFQNEPVLPKYPVRFNKASKHAELVTDTELLEQARKYGSTNFVMRLHNELKRMQIKSEEPREGYWMPKSNIYSFDPFKRKEEISEQSATTGFRHGRSVQRSVIPEVAPSTDQALKSSTRRVETDNIVQQDASSSNTHDFSKTEATSSTSEVIIPEQLRWRSPGIIRTPKHRSPKAHGRGQHAIRNIDERNPDAYKRSDILAPPPPPPPKPALPNQSERLHNLAMATASALTQVLGIPKTDAQTQPVNAFDEPARKVGKKSQHTKQAATSACQESQERKLEKSTSPDSTLNTEGNIVYRLRVESVRHLRSRRAFGYREFNSPGSSSLPNPAPPMSIVLRGTKGNAPCLKLINAELARLGEVGGHPVILRDQQFAMQRASKSGQTFGDVPMWHMSSPTGRRALDREGCPQVDYFAIVCLPLGKLTGIDIMSIPTALRQSRYDWYLKSIMIDELGKNKRYQFCCDRWLTLDAEQISCNRLRTNSLARDQKRNNASQTTDVNARSTILSNGTQISTERHLPGNDSFHQSHLPTDHLHVKSPNAGMAVSPTPISSNEPKVVGLGDRFERRPDEKTAGDNVIKNSSESILIKFPKFLKSRELDCIKAVLTEDVSFWIEDLSVDLPDAPLPEHLTEYNLQPPNQLHIALQHLYILNGETIMHLRKLNDLFIQSIALRAETIAKGVCPEMQVKYTIGPTLNQCNLPLSARRPIQSVLIYAASYSRFFMSDCLVGRAPWCKSINPLPEPDVIQWIDVYESEFDQNMEFLKQPGFEVICVTPTRSCIVATMPNPQNPYNEEVEQEEDDEIDVEQEEEEEDPPTLYARELYPHRKDVFDPEKLNAECVDRPQSLLHVPDQANDDMDEQRYYIDERWETDDRTEENTQPYDPNRLLMQADAISWSSHVDMQNDLEHMQSVDAADLHTVPTSYSQDRLQLADIYFDPNYPASNAGPDTTSQTDTAKDIPTAGLFVSNLSESAIEQRLKQIADCSTAKRLLVGGDESLGTVPSTSTSQQKHAMAFTGPYASDNNLKDEQGNNNYNIRTDQESIVTKPSLVDPIIQLVEYTEKHFDRCLETDTNQVELKTAASPCNDP